MQFSSRLLVIVMGMKFGLEMIYQLGMKEQFIILEIIGLQLIMTKKMHVACILLIGIFLHILNSVVGGAFQFVWCAMPTKGIETKLLKY